MILSADIYHRSVCVNRKFILLGNGNGEISQIGIIVSACAAVIVIAADERACNFKKVLTSYDSYAIIMT